GMAQRLITDFGGSVPDNIINLQRLPAVGRKMDNVIASVVYQAPAIAVDTRVLRVANRIGLTDAKTPLAAEEQLMKHLPRETLSIAHHWLILHGRYICIARKPKCGDCPITWMCRYYDRLHNRMTEITKDENN